MNWIYFVEIELVPLLMAVFGWLMLHHCPKDDQSSGWLPHAPFHGQQ